MLAATHPTIWRLIDTLKKEQGLTEIKINQLMVGQEPPAKRKKYREVATRIENIVATYNDCDKKEYLIGIAHNLDAKIKKYFTSAQ